MEELLAYAYLWCEGLVLAEKYEEKLHKLFLADLTGNDDLLELEGLCGNKRESAIYIGRHINYSSLDCDKFGKMLMRLLYPIYRSMDIEKFGYHMNSLWASLPGYLQNKEPFFVLNYADDPLSYGNEIQSRALYEYALSYYD